MLICSAISAMAIAAFWIGIWYSTGSMPIYQSVQLTPNLAVPLPWAIPRVYELVLGPIFSVILISLFTNEKTRKNRDKVIGLVLISIFVMAVGILAMIGTGLIGPMIATLAFAFIIRPRNLTG